MTKQTITTYTNRHEQFMQELMANSEIAAPRLKEAMIYALFPGGKRIRPLLVYLLGELIEVELPCLDIIAAAIELTHAYSLVHDDLPAMDNDDMRRGKPSCHRAYDEATAILAGDSLQIFAVDILLRDLPKYLSSPQVIAVTMALIKASGVNGMISGQCMDLNELAQAEIEESRLRLIHSLKTGRMILACANMPLAAGNQDAKASQALRDYASHLGLVFQMQDDYLDRYAEKTHGKGRSSDEVNHKLTYASIHSQQQLRELITHHYDLAKQALACFGERADKLLALTQSLQERQ